MHEGCVFILKRGMRKERRTKWKDEKDDDRKKDEKPEAHVAHSQPSLSQIRDLMIGETGAAGRMSFVAGASAGVGALGAVPPSYGWDVPTEWHGGYGTQVSRWVSQVDQVLAEAEAEERISEELEQARGEGKTMPYRSGNFPPEYEIDIHGYVPKELREYVEIGDTVDA
eukprot:1543193-Prymnesium_polylepis.1